MAVMKKNTTVPPTLPRTQAPDWRKPMRPTIAGLTRDSPPVYEEGAPLRDARPRPQDAPKDWRDVPMPQGVSDLPRDRRGYPIFLSVQKTGGNKTGDTVDFRVLNVATFLRLAQDRCCAVCGRKIGSELSFLGGPMCVQRRIFGDGPMHYDCAQYARMVCPFLINESREYDLDIPEGMGFDPNVIQKKPERLVLYVTTAFVTLDGGLGKPVCLVKPADSCEWYTPAGVYLCRTKPSRYVQ